MNRRELLIRSGAGIVVAGAGTKVGHSASEPVKQEHDELRLSAYMPRSMLQVKETHVPRSRYPVIDIHTHITEEAHAENGVPMTPERDYHATPDELLKVMNAKNIHAMVNLTGGYEKGLANTVTRYDKAHPDRFYTFTEPSYARFHEPDYARQQALAIEEAHRNGARGLKVLKTLGLYLRENVTTGKLVKIDDPRFDPMWSTCAQLEMPVAIHVSDPIAFFTPTDRFNERYEELHNHPDWSFDGPEFPSNAELLAARNRVMARHPKTRFIVLHVGNFAENLAEVGDDMDRYPNMTVDLAARIGELGRQPRTARAFFEKYQDRILFGTDATPHVDDYPQQIFKNELYEIYYRFLETEDEYFDYAPADVPPQGRWRIYGVGLPDEILRKLYYANAARELHLSFPGGGPAATEPAHDGTDSRKGDRL